MTTACRRNEARPSSDCIPEGEEGARESVSFPRRIWIPAAMNDGFRPGDCYSETKAGDDNDDCGSWVFPVDHACSKECQRADDRNDRFAVFQESEPKSAIADSHHDPDEFCAQGDGD